MSFDTAIDILKLTDVTNIFSEEMLKLLLYLLHIFTINLRILVYFSFLQVISHLLKISIGIFLLNSFDLLILQLQLDEGFEFFRMGDLKHRKADGCLRHREERNIICLPIHTVVLIELLEAVQDAEEGVAS